MYRAFEVQPFKLRNPDYWYQAGLALAQRNAEQTKARLAGMLAHKGPLDGSRMRAEWFPLVDAEIFISHAHVDSRFAIAVAGWLAEMFGLRAFIDSSVWGNAADLLKEIDENYCKTGDKLYSYEDRNASTSHVHMMLATALAKMIDRSECVWLLKTSSSISSDQDEIIRKKTTSPWIFFEVVTLETTKRKSAEMHRGLIKKAEQRVDVVIGEQRRLEIQHTLPAIPLGIIDKDILFRWERDRKNPTEARKHALDRLYDLVPEEEFE